MSLSAPNKPFVGTQLTFAFPSHGASELRAIGEAIAMIAAQAGDISISDSLEFVIEHERTRGELTEQSLDSFADLWRRFASFAVRAYGVSSFDEVTVDVVSDFVGALTSARRAAPSASTMALRQSAIKYLFKILRRFGFAAGDPTLDLEQPTRVPVVLRPLTDEEIDRCEFATVRLVETRDPAVMALAETGAQTAEIGLVRRPHVDVERAGVWLPGTGHITPRFAELTRWGTRQLARRLNTVADDETPLVYEGAGSAKSRQCSISGALGQVMRRAGLAADPRVRPRSITAWAGVRWFNETNRIDIVARRLGMQSLDQASELIGFDWRTDAPR